MGFHERSTGLRAVSEDRPEHSSFRDGDFYVQVVPILNPQRNAPDPGSIPSWHTAGVAWEAEFTDEFPRLVDALSEEQQDDVAHSVRQLIEFGPALGFPAQLKSWQFPLSADARDRKSVV